jgi:xanthine dehydrogenase molybdenum-binding subunit
MKTVTFQLNGAPQRVEVAPGESVLEVLRERFKLTSLKDACAPQGQCGCCLALVDGHPKTTCSMPADKADGKEIWTLEGVAAEEKRLYADAFQAAAGLQCGFCTPGMVLRIKALTDKGDRLTRPEIAKALDGHLCRCTGYAKIVDAVELIQTAKQGGPAPRVVEDAGVGGRLQRYQGAELTLGTRPFVADLEAPGLLHGAVTLSAHARARVLRIDTSKARALPGVVAVATARDVPGERWVGLVYRDWPVFVAEGEEVRCVGDVLAAVAAESPRIAREAARLVEVEYQPLPPVLDPAEAVEAGAPQVNPRHDNTLSTTRFERGDVDAALAGSAHVVSGTWATQRIEHLFL